MFIKAEDETGILLRLDDLSTMNGEVKLMTRTDHQLEN